MKGPNFPKRRDGMVAAEGMKRTDTSLRGALLDAAEGVASEAGGLWHHFRTKDRLIEALVMRAAEGWRAEWVFPTMCRRARADNARSGFSRMRYARTFGEPGTPTPECF